MYAVIETGGKQYRVEVGTELEVELLDVEPGQAITLDRVLLVADGADAVIGRPVVADAAVKAEVVGRERGEKVIAFKYRPKARRRVKKGHRQELTVLRIADITFNGKSAAEQASKAREDAKTERQRLEEAAAAQAVKDAALAAKLGAGAQTPAKPKRGAKTEADADAPAPKASRRKATEDVTTADATAAAPADDAVTEAGATDATEIEATTAAEASATAADTTDAADVDAAADPTESPSETRKASRTKKDE